MRGLHPKQVNFPHNWSVEDTKSYTNFPELARDMPQVWTCKFNSKTWMIKQLVTKSPTAILRNAMVHCAVWMIPGATGEHSYPEGCLWKTRQNKTRSESKVILRSPYKMHTTYRKNNNLEKCAGLGLNGFHIKCINRTHCNWRNQNPWSRFGATS